MASIATDQEQEGDEEEEQDVLVFATLLQPLPLLVLHKPPTTLDRIEKEKQEAEEEEETLCSTNPTITLQLSVR